MVWQVAVPFIISIFAYNDKFATADDDRRNGSR